MVLDEATFDAQGRALGDTVGVLAKDATTDMTIVGTATFGGVKGLPGITVLATDDATAQAMFAQTGSYDSIVVASDGTTSPAELADAVRASVGSDQVEVLTGAADTAAKQADLRKDMGFFTTFLLAFAYIALFVGMFIIYNTFSIVIAQRMREMAMLRAIGASRRQVLRAVLLESVIIGIVASAAGLLAGVAMSFGLRALLSGVGLRIPNGDLVITANTVVTAFVVGVGVTLISAVAPAVRASRIRPIAALRETAVESTSTSIPRMLVGLALSGLGVAMFAAGVVAGNDGAMALIGLGGVSVILGVFVLGPVIARPAMHVLGLPTGVSGATGHLARENAKRNPARTAATASALMIGVALVSFITIVASSSKASTAEAVDHSLRADYVVDSGSYGHGGFGPGIEHDLTAVTGVETDLPAPVEPGCDRWGDERPARRRHRHHRRADGSRGQRRRSRRRPRQRHRRRLAPGRAARRRSRRHAARGVLGHRRRRPDGRGVVRRRGHRVGGQLVHRGSRHLRGQRDRPVRPPGVREAGRRRGCVHRHRRRCRPASIAGRTPTCRIRPASRTRSPPRPT